MKNVLDKMFYLIAFIGIVACAMAGVARIFGFYYIGGFETMTLLIAGNALMVFACLIKLERISGSINS